MTDRTYRGTSPRSAKLPFHAGRIDTDDAAGMAALIDVVADAELPPVVKTAAQPFIGVTTDGTPLRGLSALEDQELDTSAITSAADAYLEVLDREQRQKATLPVDSREWQLWINAFLTFPEHGLLLDTLSAPQRDAVVGVITASLSATGLRDVRTAMRLNAALGDLCAGYEDTLREWMYWFTIFGTPSDVEPWGWQLMGHHLDVHCFIVGRQMVLTPTFIGTEFEGHQLFAEHIRRGTELVNGLSRQQRDKAVLYPSIHNEDLPHHLAGAIDGRHRAGAGRDNLVLPYEGVRADSFSSGQRELLLALVEPYVAALPSGPRQARLRQVERHFDDTRFAWIGGWQDGAPFYYRIHSPVILVEYDNHSGIFLDNDQPAPFHVHTIVRTPHGGDYGKDLLRQHYERHHRTRTS
ncbi:MAG: DUF3500 domain-containing protein [Pseudonocardia sp.]|nr:DUF3500 domain-containing protein [Pseudonocardia sp.]